MSDHPVRTRVTLADPPLGESPEVAFQDYFVRLAPRGARRGRSASTAPTRPGPPPGCSRPSPRPTGRRAARPTRSCRSARSWRSPGSDRPRGATRRVVAVSPIVAGAALKGPADRLLRELGHEASAVGVARLYASWAGTLVIDEADGGLAPPSRRSGCAASVAPTVMTDRARRRRWRSWCSMPP